MNNQAVFLERPSQEFYLDQEFDCDLDKVPQCSKWSFITRNVEINDVSHIAMRMSHPPSPGDLILANIKKVSQHAKIQLRSGRRSQLYIGDSVIVVYGNRYAPDQFEAIIPSNLADCHLVAAGGIAAKAISKHTSIKWPTELKPLGYCIGSDGKVLNLNQYAIAAGTDLALSPPVPVIAVLGTSMNSGKTTTAAALVRGLNIAGYSVAAIKVTGTGAGNDLWAYADSGAKMTLDFTDAGFASTYKLSNSDIQSCFQQLIKTAEANPAINAIVVEVADGLLHPETTNLVASKVFQQRISKVLFAAGESMGAVAGVKQLESLGIRPAALSGLLSASQLTSSEAISATGIPVITKASLEKPHIAKLLD